MKDLIKEILYLSNLKREGHIGSSLSILDILYVLYKNVICSDSQEDRNRLILSKGHAALALYVVLKKFNLLNCDIKSFCDFDSPLGGHPSDKIASVEASTGSLGHGLPISIGMAIGYKIQNFKNRVYVIVGDGEMNEGSMWESILVATNRNLNNLTCIIDYNHSNDRSIKLDNLEDQLKAFNCNVVVIDGHDHDQILNAVLVTDDIRPTFIIANTIKGKGISRMENNPEWHHKSPDNIQYQEMLIELSNE